MRRWIPGILYLSLFCVLGYPSITLFRSHVLSGEGDGLQNLWNLWWFYKSVIIMHQSPWFTTYLHFPHGTSLIGHTLNPFNGFVALAFLPWLSLHMTYNLILTGSFVATGWTTYLLAMRLNIGRAGSLLSGAIVTFSNYHFAHAQGQLQLESFEWVPIFFLFWITFLQKPQYRYAAGSAIALFLILLCDYYYTLYALLGAAIITVSYGFRFITRENLPKYARAIVPFILLTLILCGPFVWALNHLAREGTMWGVHSSNEFSLDLLSPFVPGGHWRFASLTEPLWSRWSSNIHENSTYLGWTVIMLILFSWRRRKEIQTLFLPEWFWVMIVFFILALGPSLHVEGHEFHKIILPYRLLERVFPLLRISGCPIRMISMVVLAVGLIAGAGFSFWLERNPRTPVVILFLMVMALEYWPQPLPATLLTIPGYVQALANAPPGAVIDAVSGQTWMLYYQTIHGKPIGLGYISRVPASVQAADQKLIFLYQQGDFQTLHDRFGFRYILTQATGPNREICQRFHTLYDDNQTLLVDLAR